MSRVKADATVSVCTFLNNRRHRSKPLAPEAQGAMYRRRDKKGQPRKLMCWRRQLRSRTIKENRGFLNEDSENCSCGGTKRRIAVCACKGSAEGRRCRQRVYLFVCGQWLAVCGDRCGD